MKRAFLFLTIILSYTAYAQQDISIKCPLDDAIMKEQQGAYKYDKGGDWKIVVISRSDSVVKAGFDGKISNVAKAEGKTYDVVMHLGNYYAWYSGVRNPVVKVGQRINKGETLGSIKPRDELEVMLFYFETPMDIRKYLQCVKGK